jgi:hypothetical protein
MKNLVKFLGVCLFLVSITFAAEAEVKNWSSMKSKTVYDKKLSVKVAGFELGFSSGYQGIQYKCGFTPFSKCDTDKQRFEAK